MQAASVWQHSDSAGIPAGLGFGRTSLTFRCWSGSRRCDAFSEKERLIISSTLSASTRSRLRIMLYVRRNWLDSFVAWPRSILFKMPVCKGSARGADQTSAALTSGTSSLALMMTTPVGSRPRRPARPDICVY